MLTSGFTPLKNDNQKLWELFGQYKEYVMHTYPEWATYEGDHRYDSQVTDLSIKGIKNNFISLRKFINDLEKIESSSLSADNKINYDLFKNDLADNIEKEKFIYQYLPITQLDGIHIDFPQIIDSQPFETAEDFQKYFERLREASKQIDNVIERMKLGIKNNVVQPAYIIEQIIKETDEIKNTKTDEMPYFIPALNNKTLGENELKFVRSELKNILEENIKPAYQRLDNFLKDDYLKHARTTDGVWSLPNGEKLYQFEIRNQTTTNLTAEEIHQIGLKEVARILGEMEKVKNETGFKGTLQEFNNFLKTDPQFYYSNTDDLLNGYRDILKQVDKKLPDYFGRLPKAKYEVKEIESYKAKSSPQAYYYNAPEDGSRPGYFYANTYDLFSRPKYTMVALCLHEAVPGHHLQISIAQELENFPWFRKQLGMTAFVEGWALYAESLGYEMGMYNDKYQHYGALTYEMERACRLVIDTGLHYKKWTREEAYQYLRAHTPSSDIDVRAEIDRYVIWPGQALAYKIGELKIKELRKLAEDKLKDKFSLKEFHDHVLINGAIPLSLLEKNIKDWINSKTK
ncbi:MAG: DUF885 domain-containing protein [Candidatus Sericytochromatia bacterium]|nr:DUF885 domain-containing protein [Candidatus Sericytochromatia bacterium]